jgi:hypothetical protein
MSNVKEKILSVEGTKVTVRETETFEVDKVEYLAELKAKLIKHDEEFDLYKASSTENRRQLVRQIKQLEESV